MKINWKSQLGLRLNDLQTQINMLELLKEDNKWMLDWLNGIIDKGHKEGEALLIEANDDAEANLIKGVFDQRGVIEKINTSVGEQNFIDGVGSKYFFICDTVYMAAELIRVNTGFTGRTLKDVSPGKYTYLMGKNQCVRFICHNGALMGFFYNETFKSVFEFGVELDTGRYYFSPRWKKEFTMIMQVLTFIELGDIDVKILEAGRNNGGKRDVNKITNTSDKTVFVVDSSWNQIVIRTDGFAVRGHFRLQACGEGMKDRRLLWIDAFEKHGYKRRPTGEIVK